LKDGSLHQKSLLKFYFPANNDTVFTSFRVSPPSLLVVSEVFHGPTFQFLNFADADADGSPSIWCLFKMIAIFETLHYLTVKLQLCPDSSVNQAAVTIQNRSGEAISDLFLKLNYTTYRVPAAKKVAPSDGHHHPMMVQITSYLTSATRSSHMLEQNLQEYPSFIIE